MIGVAGLSWLYNVYDIYDIKDMHAFLFTSYPKFVLSHLHTCTCADPDLEGGQVVRIPLVITSYILLGVIRE